MTTFEKILAVSAAISFVLVLVWLVWAVFDICRDISEYRRAHRRNIRRDLTVRRLADTLEWRAA